MLNKTKYLILLFFVLLAVISGCKKSTEEDNLKNQEIQNQSNNLTENNNSDLINLVNLIGLTNDKVVNLLGEGIQTSVADNNSINSREYQYVLKDERFTALVNFKNGLVYQIYSKLPNTEFDKWEGILTNELGTPTRVEDTKRKVTYIIWKINEKIITFYGLDGSLWIQME